MENKYLFAGKFHSGFEYKKELDKRNVPNGGENPIGYRPLYD